MEKKFLDFYEKCMESGELLPEAGLCQCKPFKGSKEFRRIKATGEEQQKLQDMGLTSGYWGSGLPYYTNNHEVTYSFTPLRQTIVLLCAAMAGELD